MESMCLHKGFQNKVEIRKGRKGERGQIFKNFADELYQLLLYSGVTHEEQKN